jgi:hypothetical protein
MQSRVYSVETVEVEFLMVIPENPPAIAVSAEGWVVTSGWTHPDLAPWMYIAPPKDGILDLDFVATPPTGLVLEVFSRIRVVKTFPIPAWLRGVRVHSSTNSVEAMLEKAAQSSVASMKEAVPPGPWPFPWWAPKSIAK